MSERACVGCGRSLPPTAVYYRFAIAIEGELDVVDDGSPDAADPRAILERLEREVDPKAAEDEVHWEQSGVLCAACRAEVVARLRGRPTGPVRH